MVFQSYALYPHMTVYENIAFGLGTEGRRKSDIDRRVRERPRCSSSSRCSSASRGSSRADSGSASRSAGRSCASPRCCSWTSRCRTWTPSSASQTRAEILKLHQRVGDHHDLRDPRPGRGDDDGRPDRGDEAGVLQQVGTPEELYTARQRLRRGVHRLARDEPRARRADRVGRERDAAKRRVRRPRPGAVPRRDRPEWRGTW